MVDHNDDDLYYSIVIETSTEDDAAGKKMDRDV
jgi:hypothetical protein